MEGGGQRAGKGGKVGRGGGESGGGKEGREERGWRAAEGRGATGRGGWRVEGGGGGGWGKGGGGRDHLTTRRSPGGSEAGPVLGIFYLHSVITVAGQHAVAGRNSLEQWHASALLVLLRIAGRTEHTGRNFLRERPFLELFVGCRN